jgi:polyhydroxyalkanoate synthesis repressor PhaR
MIIAANAAIKIILKISVNYRFHTELIGLNQPLTHNIYCNCDIISYNLRSHREVFAMPNDPILIIRYPNRRFYARNESRYVSLQEIEEMVRRGDRVEIRDSQSGDDLTASVLTRIIIDRQPDKMRLFPVDMLHFVLRSNDVMADFLRDYFRHALPYLDYLQRQSAGAMNMLQPMHWINSWLNGIAPRPAQPDLSSPNPAPPEAASPPPDSTAFAARVAELEARIRQLEAARGQKEQIDAGHRSPTGAETSGG